MRLAYFLPVHKYAHLFKRIFRAIYDAENTYLIHIDKKSEPSFHQEIRDFLSPYANVRFMPSYDCVYYGYSTLDIDLKAIKELLNEKWDFFLNVSGQDFPLKSQAYIRNYLESRRDKNFVQVRDIEKEWKKISYRAHWYVIELKINSRILQRKRLLPTPIWRPYPKGYRRYGGSAWCILNREFCEYLTLDPSYDRLKRFMKHTIIPEEEFFQTVIMNSPFKDTVINDNKRFITFQGIRMFDNLARTVGLRGYYYSRMKLVTMDDLDKLTKSDAFFARKVDESVDPRVIDVLESRLLPPENPPSGLMDLDGSTEQGANAGR